MHINVYIQTIDKNILLTNMFSSNKHYTSKLILLHNYNIDSSYGAILLSCTVTISHIHSSYGDILLSVLLRSHISIQVTEIFSSLVLLRSHISIQVTEIFSSLYCYDLTYPFKLRRYSPLCTVTISHIHSSYGDILLSVLLRSHISIQVTEIFSSLVLLRFHISIQVNRSFLLSCSVTITSRLYRVTKRYVKG